jgi:hypothetical protein
MKWMRLKIVTGVKSFSKPEQPQPKKSKFLSASALFYGQAERGIMKWMRLKIVTGVKSFSKPEQPQPKKSKFLSASELDLLESCKCCKPL